MKKAHLVISQLQHDNRELRKSVLERTPKIGEIEQVIKENSYFTNSKGKENVVT